jgi:hypothetical protein
VPLALRLLTLRVVAVVCALGWLVWPGFGVPDLLVSWSPDWPVALEAGWGLFSAVVLAVAFLAIAVRPRRAAPALVQVWTAAAALAVAVPAGGELPAVPLAGLLLAEAAVVTALVQLLPGRERVRPLAPVPWVPLLAVALCGAVGWVAYAVAECAAARGGARVDVTVGVDHSVVQGALALTLAALAVVAAVWPRGRRFLGLVAGLAGGYLGLVSLASPGTPAGAGPVWSVLAAAWGVAVTVLAAVGSPARAGGRPAGTRRGERTAARSDSLEA